MSIEDKSTDLKVIIGAFETDSFLSEMAVLLTYIENGLIPYQPFNRLHSPFRQICYLAALNLSFPNTVREEYNPRKKNEQFYIWDRVIDLLLELDDAYEQVFTNQEKVDGVFAAERIRVAYPSFIDYFYSGPLNFEEQVIERIERYFTNHTSQIEAQFGLNVSDFIKIYNIVDEEMHRLMNRVFELLKIGECRIFWESMRELNDRPNTWEFTDSDVVNELIKLMKDQSERLKVAPQNLYKQYDSKKIDLFFQLLCCNDKVDNDFLLFTQENFLLKYPLFELEDGRFLVTEIKQVIHAIYDMLFGFCIRNEQAAQRFYKKRGVELEIKIEEVVKKYFGRKTLIFRDYKTKLGKGQDVLVFCKGVVVIIEAKSSKKDKPALNVNAAFNKVKSNFIEIFQKGFEQTDRVEELFSTEDYVDIFDRKGKFLFRVRTKNVHHVFSIIVTLEKFSQVQTDLSLLLKKEVDIPYPYSICIDDLEVFLLTMKREKCSLQDFTHFMERREQFYGRLECKDELELCAQFFYRKQLQVPPGDAPVVINGSDGGDIFDKYYESGLGFENEKNIDRKRNGRFMKWPNTEQILKLHREINAD